jgi:hypothetical protein
MAVGGCSIEDGGLGLTEIEKKRISIKIFKKLGMNLTNL